MGIMGKIHVKMPDGTMIPMSFPDDWSKDQIQEAIIKHFPDMGSDSSSIANTPFNNLQNLQSMIDQSPFPQKQVRSGLMKLAELLQQHPQARETIGEMAQSPITEMGISAGTELINALKNMVDLAPVKFKIQGQDFPGFELRGLSSPRLTEKTERGFPAPTTLSGKAGSLIGSILGGGTAMMAIPGATTIPGGLATAFAQSEGGAKERALSSLSGLIAPGVAQLIKGGRALVDKNKAKKLYEALRKEEYAAQEGVRKSQTDAAQTINNQLEPIIEQKNELETILNNYVPESKSNAKYLVSNELKKAKEEIKTHYSNLYENFNKSEAGQKNVNSPISIKNFKDETGLDIKNLSPETKKMVESVIGKEVKADITPDVNLVSAATGKPIAPQPSKFLQAKPKVSEYINLSKQLRDEIYLNKSAAKQADTVARKQRYKSAAEKLQNFKNVVDEKIKKSLSPEEWDSYLKIQEGYKNHVVPFTEVNLLENATDKFPVVPDNFHEKLSGQGVNELMNLLKNNFPDLVHSISKHDLRNVANKSADELDSLLKSDFGQFIHKDIKRVIQDLKQRKEAENYLRKALTHVQRSRVGREVKASDIKEIFNKNPELKKPLDSIKAQQERLQKIKNELIEAGFKADEAEKALKKIKLGKSLSAAALSGIGAYTGAKKRSSLDN